MRSQREVHLTDDQDPKVQSRGRSGIGGLELPYCPGRAERGDTAVQRVRGHRIERRLTISTLSGEAFSTTLMPGSRVEAETHLVTGNGARGKVLITICSFMAPRISVTDG